MADLKEMEGARFVVFSPEWGVLVHEPPGDDNPIIWSYALTPPGQKFPTYTRVGTEAVIARLAKAGVVGLKAMLCIPSRGITAGQTDLNNYGIPFTR
jgi:hypothetical protein